MSSGFGPKDSVETPYAWAETGTPTDQDKEAGYPDRVATTLGNPETPPTPTPPTEPEGDGEPVEPVDLETLPDDFPGVDKLREAGITTYATVAEHLDALTDIKGIGDATAEKIRAALAESPE